MLNTPINTVYDKNKNQNIYKPDVEVLLFKSLTFNIVDGVNYNLQNFF